MFDRSEALNDDGSTVYGDDSIAGAIEIKATPARPRFHAQLIG